MLDEPVASLCEILRERQTVAEDLTALQLRVATNDRAARPSIRPAASVQHGCHSSFGGKKVRRAQQGSLRSIMLTLSLFTLTLTLPFCF